MSPRESEEAYRAAVLRDLEQLLNTRNPFFDLSPDFIEVAQSALSYGLPDISALRVRNPADQLRLKQTVESTLRRFEPRLTAVVVTFSEGPASERSLRLRVDARLVMDPSPQPVSFDIVMPFNSRRYEVKEAN